MEYSIHPKITEADKTYCVNCKSDNLKRIKEKSSWSFFEECTKCGEKHHWAYNDMMGGALHTYTLLYNGKDWNDRFYKDAILD